MTTPANVLDLTARLRRKRSSECAHEYVEVDNEIASLTCAACQSELDPWWFLRRMAAQSEEEYAERLKAHDEYARWLEQANAALKRRHDEIAALTATKNRLWNEQINGRPLGSMSRRPRQRKKPTP